MKNARRRTVLLALAAVGGIATGCNAILGLDYKLGAKGGDAGDGDVPDTDVTDGGVDEPDVFVGECTTNQECTDRFTALGPLPIDAGPDADAAADAGTYGALDGGVVPGVCVKPEFKCVRVLSEDCKAITGNWKSDDSILVATLFSLTGSQGPTNLPRQQAATMAAEEITTAGGIPGPGDGGTPQGRPLVVVSCDESLNIDRVGEHLAHELHVPGIVGPNTSQDTIALTTKETVSGGTLIITPTGVASQIADLTDNDLTWRAVPNDVVRAPLMIRQISGSDPGSIESQMVGGGITRAGMPRPVKLAIVYRNDALGIATFNSLSSNLQLNGASLNTATNNTGCGGAACYVIKPYNPAVPAERTAIVSALTTFQPDIIALIGTAESVTGVMAPLEAAWSVTDRPYYVLIDSNRVPELIAATTSRADLRARVRGTGLFPSTESTPVFNSFQLNYGVRYQTTTPDISGLGPSYDGMYAIAYALAATRNEPPTGAAVSRGLRRLANPSATKIEVGSQRVLAAFNELKDGNEIRAIGTFSPLEWDSNGDIVQGTIEMWCISSSGTTFGHSGLYYDTKTGVFSGSYVQCN